MYSFLSRKQCVRNTLTGLVGFIGLMSFANQAQAASLNLGDLAVSAVANPTGAVSIDDYTTSGSLVSTIALPNSSTTATGIVSAYNSQFEGALTESVNGQYLTYYGYQAPTTTNAAGATALSTSYTSSTYAPSSSTGPFYSRVVAEINIATGAVDTSTALTDANSGADPRASISVNGNQFYTVGNASLATNDNTTTTIGAHYSSPLGATTSVNLGTATNTGVPSKSENFNSVGIYNNTLYVSKGSGGSGINGIFQVGTAGTLPTTGSTANNIIELPGFSTASGSTSIYHPDGFFFANATTLYVSDQGGTTATAGLEKWLYNGTQWNLAYTIQSGLNLGSIPTGSTSNTVGIRNVSGQINTANGTVNLDAITAQATATDTTDLVGVTDILAATTLPTGESFTTLAVSPTGQIFRGVAFISNSVPEPSSILGSLGSLGFGAFFVRRLLKSRNAISL